VEQVRARIPLCHAGKPRVRDDAVMDRIETSRLLLRAWSEDDAEAAYAVLSHDEVWPWLGAEPKPCPDVDTARRICARWTGLADDVLGVWAVDATALALPADAPEPCGSVLLLTLPRSDGDVSDAVEIGWHLHPSAWGRGIATEGALALVGRARAAGLTRLHAVVREANTRSLAVCDRLGMTRLGPTDEWYGTTFVDHVLDL
jgi:RimJ/RimL family protein N-acetyltransferase